MKYEDESSFVALNGRLGIMRNVFSINGNRIGKAIYEISKS